MIFLKKPFIETPSLNYHNCLTNNRKGMSKEYWKLRAHTKFLRPVSSIFIENYNFSSNLKIGHFGSKMGIWFIDYSDERIDDKKLRFTGNER